ncbi:MAG: hypothetical protein ACLFV2_06620 [Desulfurivibrionaceae bacterium]
MKNRTLKQIALITSLLSLVPVWFSPATAAEIEVHFRYRLSDFQGPIPYQWAELAVDPGANEVYALNRQEDEIRIFNNKGMEIYRCPDHRKLGGLRDIAVAENGNIFLTRGRSTTTILRLDYRCGPLSEIELREIPEDFSPFRIDHLYRQQDRFYLADSRALRILVADRDGLIRESYDLKKIMLEQSDGKMEAEDLEEIEIAGFSVDRHGTMYFTIPTLFSAYRLGPDRTLEAFGSSGSGPGKFGVVAGITTDRQGRVYVSDRLGSKVMVFNRNFNFLTEFGYRGSNPDNLIVPNEIATGPDGKLYVAQGANRGVSVFKVSPTYEELPRN